MTSKTIGNFIAQARKQRGWSQAQLAQHLGVLQGSISHWECGRSDVGRQQFVLIADALQIPETEWPAAMRLPQEPASDASSAAVVSDADSAAA